MAHYSTVNPKNTSIEFSPTLLIFKYNVPRGDTRLFDLLRSTQKLSNAVKVTYLAAFFFTAMFWPLSLFAKDSFPCGTQSQVVRALMADHQAFVATMVQDQHIVWQLFVNLRTGAWTIILIDDKQNACVIARGYDFQPAAGRDL